MRPPVLLLLAAAFAVAAPAHAQTRAAAPVAAPSVATAPGPLVVMNLAAHPDDEDGATMAYYRHVENAVVYSVVYTRGEGGQNEIGPDLYERLGAIRTGETEAAARVLGTQVWWLGFYDFGFSKWAREAFSEWSRPRHGFWDTAAPVRGEAAGRDTVTARLVYLIRRLKPDVMFTNHDTVTVGPRAQHGQHQAVGLSAWAAFSLAADPTYHPEQLREPGVSLWQPSRLFVRGRQAEGADVAVPLTADCGGGVSCIDRAISAAVLHRSQGFDKFAPQAFRRDASYFTLYRAAPGVPALPPGATSLAAGLTPAPRPAPFAAATTPYDAGFVPPLPGGVRNAYAVVFPGQLMRIRWTPPAGLDGTLTLTQSPLRPDTLGSFPLADSLGRFRLPLEAAPTLPAARAQYGRLLSGPPVSYTVTDPEGRVRYGGPLSFEIAPPVIADLVAEPIRLVHGENEIPVALHVYSPTSFDLQVTLRVERSDDPGPPVYQSTRRIQPASQATVFSFGLGNQVPPGPYRVVVETVADSLTAPYVVSRPAAVLPDVRVAEGLRVGLVQTYDDTTEEALRAMGATVVPLDSTALAAGRFEGLDTIVLDIRAYLVRPDLRRYNGRLLAWVRGGGHLVVGYNKTMEWNPGEADPTAPEGSVAVNPDFAPYPLVLSHDRVVTEDAPVTVLQPGSPLLNAPNRITPDDWAGWVQERGLYFPTTYSPEYQEILAMNDPGEAPLRGGLLLARVGAGTYLYSPLVWYRELEALNPGAWRLFANLVSLPRTDGRDRRRVE